MEVFEAVKTRLETREFGQRSVSAEIKRQILEAARLAPSGMNLQHWHFILLDKNEDLRKLAELSTTGQWIDGANFAVVVLTNPKYPFHSLDAGRAITNMQLAAWSHGVGSRIYTGYNDQGMRSFLNVPKDLAISAVVGFGYPAEKVIGKKNRVPLNKVASYQKFGKPIDGL
jgi:nitroreductase